MKDQENTPQKGNQANPTSRTQNPQTTQKAGNQEWNKGAETAKKGNQNWDEEKERKPQTTAGQPKTATTPRPTATGTTPQPKASTGTTNPQSKTGSNPTSNR